MRTKLFRRSCVFFLVVVLLSFFSFGLIKDGKISFAEEEGISHLTETDYEITNIEKPNGIDIFEYGEQYYGGNATDSAQNDPASTQAQCQTTFCCCHSPFAKNRGDRPFWPKKHDLCIVRRFLYRCILRIPCTRVSDLQCFPLFGYPNYTGHILPLSFRLLLYSLSFTLLQ